LALRTITPDRQTGAAASRRHPCIRLIAHLPSALLLAGVALAGGAVKAQAQAPAQVLIGARQLSIHLGHTPVSYDDDCDDPFSFFTSARLSFAGDRFGGSVAYVHEDWPWPPEEELEGQFLLRHGDAFQAMAELYPLGFLGVGDTRIGRMIRPFVGVGAQVSRDGDRTAGPTGLTVYGVRGSVDPVAAAGASLFLRPSILPATILVQYRQTALFSSDFELQGPQGVIELDGETSTWGDLSIGVSFGVGG
jgi:hypothetical protein